jgi:hypothetical protein
MSCCSWSDAAAGADAVLLFAVRGKRGGVSGRVRGRRDCSGPLATTGFVSGRHICMQSRELAHHLFVILHPLCMHGLGVLAEIVESRELLAAVTGERAFACVFPRVCVWLSTL